MPALWVQFQSPVKYPSSLARIKFFCPVQMERYLAAYQLELTFLTHWGLHKYVEQEKRPRKNNYQYYSNNLLEQLNVLAPETSFCILFPPK